MSQVLVSFDTDRIKEYIFSTSVLSDIREASSLLDRLNNRKDQPPAKGEDVLDAIQTIYSDFDRDDPKQCIYAAGGGVMVLLPENIAEQAICAVERLYRETTVTASITGVAGKITDEECEKSFGQKAGWLGHLLRKRKAAKGKNRTLPVAPYMHFCAACAQHPAAHEDEGELICRACQKKRTHAKQKARSELWEKLIAVTQEDRLPSNFPSIEWTNLLDETLGKETHKLHKSPQDFGDIGKSARRSGYIAFIYADGNNMGRVLGNLSNPQAYHDFSENVDDLLRRVTYKALMKHVPDRRHKPLFEILMIGGDDLMLVTTPDVAFEVTLELTEDFEKYSKPLVQSHGVPCLSIGTGIVIAQDHFPIAAMQELAAALQKKAKQRSFEAGGGGAVDFMLVTTAGSESLDKIRNKVLTQEGFAFPPRGKDPAYRLTQRPYTLSELRDLLARGREIKASGFSQGQLQAMYEGLFHSPMQASLSSLQTLGHIRTKPLRALQNFFRQFGPRSPLQFPPWRSKKKKIWDDEQEKEIEITCWDTALGDLIEIYPFI